MLIVDDGSPDGTGELADELAAEGPASMSSTAPPRRASAARTSRASSGLHPSRALIIADGRRLHPRPGRPARLAAAEAAPISPSAPATCRAAAPRTGAGGRCSRAAGRSTRAPLLGMRPPRPHRRVRLLPPRRRSRPSTRRVMLAATLPDRDQVPAAQGRLRIDEIPIMFVDRASGSRRCRVAIFVEAIWKVPALQAGRVAGERVNETTDAGFANDVLCFRRPGRSSCSGRRGASRARRSSRSLRRWPPSTGSPRTPQPRRAPRRARPLRRPLAPDGDPLRGR